MVARTSRTEYRWIAEWVPTGPTGRRRARQRDAPGAPHRSRPTWVRRTGEVTSRRRPGRLPSVTPPEVAVRLRLDLSAGVRRLCAQGGRRAPADRGVSFGP